MARQHHSGSNGPTKATADDRADSGDAAQKTTRRKFLEALGSALVGGVVADSGSRLYQHYEDQRGRRELLSALAGARASYGTLEAPLFRANVDLPYGNALIPYKKLQESKNLDLPQSKKDQFLKACDNAESRLSELEERLLLQDQNAAPQGAGPLPSVQDMREISSLSLFCARADAELMEVATDGLNSTLNSILLDSALDELALVEREGDFTDGAKEFGHPVEFVKKAVKGVTGRELPDSVSFEIRSIDDPLQAGFSRFDERLVVSENMNYGALVLVFAHEVGHLLVQHQEDFLGANQHQRPKEEVSAWEEACAYAFESVVAA